MNAVCLVVIESCLFLIVACLVIGPRHVAVVRLSAAGSAADIAKRLSPHGVVEL